MDNLDISVYIYKISTAIVTSINHKLKPYHLTFQQFLILWFISQQKGEVIGKDICQYLGISHPTAVGLTSRMIRHDFLIFSISKKDRRQTSFALSKRGREVLEETQGIVDGVQKKIILALGGNTDLFKECLLGLENVL
ncbi:MarR family winged helix-turn-helix transcriptional regulator [Candidatus Stoquefichus massiliensis]|uniref:MarR family winged helix-turn-helix transcriptional regulator n=1 Tax=Candidatus Stoquefichus massiliensis TaxID=1470350 RepID=UPI0004AFB6F2|nr:MarR family transcriptional regulator [Candidatus Stoquefichus massiliensis]